jgi:DNA-binding MarR family transcriptional regulator
MDQTTSNPMGETLDQTTSNPKGETMDQTTHSIPKTSDSVKLQNVRKGFTKIPKQLTSGHSLGFYEIAGAICMGKKERKDIYQYGFDYLANRFGFSRNTVRKHIEELEELGYVKRKGVTKSGTIEFEVDRAKMEKDFYPDGTFYPLPYAVIDYLTTSTERYIFALLTSRWLNELVATDSPQFIADQLHLDLSTVKKTLIKLQEKGYVEKMTTKTKHDLITAYQIIRAEEEERKSRLESELVSDRSEYDLFETLENLKNEISRTAKEFEKLQSRIKRAWLAPTEKSREIIEGIREEL